MTGVPGVTVASGQAGGIAAATFVALSASARASRAVIVAVGSGVGVVTNTVIYVGGISGFAVGSGGTAVADGLANEDLLTGAVGGKATFWGVEIAPIK